MDCEPVEAPILTSIHSHTVSEDRVRATSWKIPRIVRENADPKSQSFNDGCLPNY